MIEMQRNQLAQANVSLEDYLKHVDKTMEDLRSELEPNADKKVKGSLILTKIAELDSIEVNDEEIDEEIDRMAPADLEDKSKFKELFANPITRGSIVNQIRTKKTLHVPLQSVGQL